ncbi:beta-hexosaminidase-like [Octopus sinensis]|uniref:beta-N-acetylhexosaminidase n=1 Tax=Octopus sinensis TaxID=2607531 RepID=A0A6P7T6W7_9MOLL|nr:beta-hexosaminidase-like [Octopus sinensis]
MLRAIWLAVLFICYINGQTSHAAPLPFILGNITEIGDLCKNFEGFLRMPSDCRNVFQCTGTEARALPTCPVGQVFSLQKHVCVNVSDSSNDCQSSVDWEGYQLKQSDIDYIADFVEIQYEVLHNSPEKNQFFYEVELTLINHGFKTVLQGEWKIYFCNIMRIASTDLDKTYGVMFKHTQGCLYELSVTKNFKPIYPGQLFKIRYWGENWSVSKTDVMPNWYVKSNNVKSRVLKSTAGESLKFVKPFKKPDQYKRGGTWDKFHPYSPSERYGLNILLSELHQKKAAERIIPKPQMYVRNSHKQIFILPSDWVIVTAKETTDEAQFLSDKLKIPVVQKVSALKKFIFLSVGKLHFIGDGSRPDTDEDYELTIHEGDEKILIKGAGRAGVFYGIQSLLSLKTGNPNSGFTVPIAFIRDRPRYSYRGVQIDVGRNFHSKECILKLIEAMATYKMNKLHLHLTDDEGWRIEIPGLPELTSIGAKRCDDMSERTCLMSQLGSGPNMNSSVNGYYTVQDYVEILKAAKKHHIEVIPELDMPGHARAAIKSMEARSKAVSGSMGSMFLLTDPNDKSRYRSVQMFSDNALNPCVTGSFRFLTHLLNELKAMHKPIMPLKNYHFGGDEVGDGAWLKSPACQKLMKSSAFTTSEIKHYFVSMVSNLTAPFNLDISAWEDGLMDTSDRMFPRQSIQNENVTAYAWDNIWEWNKASRAYKFANAGYKVVMAQATHLYFDHPYEPDPEERGYYWATRFIDTRKTFGFQPGNIYANIDMKRNGEKLTYGSVCGPSGSLCEKLKKPENIIGLQCNVWSESVRTDEQVFEMFFPRLLAAAERAWHEADWEKNGTQQGNETSDFTEFITTVGYRELLRLDMMGITYRVPPPGALINSTTGQIHANSAIPGLKIEFSPDGQNTWITVDKQSKAYSGQKLYLRTRSADGKRTSRVISLDVR